MKIQTIQPPAIEVFTALASAFAISFRKNSPGKIIDRKTFNDRIQSILWTRYEVLLDADNLLTPIETKGVHEIFRLHRLDQPALPHVYELDLPTIITYSLLLESKKLRLAFAQMSYREKQYVFHAIHRAIYSICPDQCFCSERDFEVELSLRINYLLAQCGDETTRQIIHKKNTSVHREALL